MLFAVNVDLRGMRARLGLRNKDKSLEVEGYSINGWKALARSSMSPSNSQGILN
jgi:hypothetical protein